MNDQTPLNRNEARRIALRKAYAGPEATPAAPAQSEVKQALEALNKAFSDFRDSNDKRLADLERGREDVVQNEQVDRINAAVTDLDKTVSALVNQVQVASVAPSGNAGGPTAAQREHSNAFRAWVRGRTSDDAFRAAAAAAVQNAATTDNNENGGFLVPDAVSSEITRVQGTLSMMRSLATVRTIGTQSYKLTKSLGGAGKGWVGERSSRPETTTPTLSEIEIPTHEIYAQPAATQTMLDDAAVDVEQWFNNEVGIAFDEDEGDAFLNGNGVNKPKGLLQYTKVANASWAWGKTGFVVSGAAATIDDSDELFDLVYALKPAFRQNGRFLMNDATTAIVRKLKDGDGNYIWAPGLQGEPATLCGYPVSHDDNMPDVGANNFPLAFGDFARAYLIVDRTGVRVLRDPLTSKPYVLFYTTKRVGGGVQDFEAFKLMKCST